MSSKKILIECNKEFFSKAFNQNNGSTGVILTKPWGRGCDCTTEELAVQAQPSQVRILELSHFDDTGSPSAYRWQHCSRI